MNRSLVALCLLISLWAAAAFAAPDRVPVREDRRTSLDVTRRDGRAMVLRAEIGELLAERIETPVGAFTRVTIPGFHAGRVPGRPELPQMNRLIAIPHGAEARIEIVGGETRTIDLAAIGSAPRLMPAQPSLSKSADPDTATFVYDRSAYSVDEVSRPAAVFKRLGRLRAMDVGRLEISPVRYLPRENKLLVTESMDVRVVFEGGDAAAGDRLAESVASPFFQPVYERIAGAGDFHASHPDMLRDPVTMVVVAPDSLVAPLADYLAWKKARGFRMVVGVTGTAEVGSDRSSIREYLAGLYRDGTPGQPAPTFVLLVGDVDILPTWTLGGNATDRPYCEMDGDLFPDMYYGRFSVESAAELAAVAAKTIAYEQLTMPDPSYLGDAMLIAGVDSDYAPVYANGQIRYAAQTYFNAAHGIDASVFLYPDSAGEAETIKGLAGAGAGFINYTAHGSEVRWSNPRFMVEDVDALENFGRYGLVIGNCCLTAKFDHDTPCFGEAWLRAPDAGAIGYIGGSNSTYWDEDYWWSVGYTAQITDSPTYELTSQGGLDGLFHENGEESYVTADAVVFCGNLAVSEAASEGATGREEYYWNIYNLLGDPSVVPYMREPQAHPVTAPDKLAVTATTLEIGADPGSYVGLTQNGVLLASGAVGATGSVSLPIRGTLDVGLARLVITAQNRIPAILDVPVAVPALVTIAPESIVVSTATDLTVTVHDAETGDPLAGVEVWAEGLNYRSAGSTTDAQGEAVIQVLYDYGPDLTVAGRDPGQPFDAFRRTVDVAAAPLTDPDLMVSSTSGVTDAFPLNIEGLLAASYGETGAMLWLFPDGAEPASTTGNGMFYTATAVGEAVAVIALPGYDLYEETFPIVKVYGTISGTVFFDGVPAAGVPVRGLDQAGLTAFQAVTNDQGLYAVTTPVPAADYILAVDVFAYDSYRQDFFLVQGLNIRNIDLESSPTGVAEGLVLDVETSLPLEALVRIFRPDNGEIFAEGASDPQDGVFRIEDLPAETYDTVVLAEGYAPAIGEVEIEGGQVPSRLFALRPVRGDILLLDGANAVPVNLPSAPPVSGKPPLPAAELEPDPIPADMAAALSAEGYEVTVENVAMTDTAGWADRDLVILSCGRNRDPLVGQPAIRAALAARAAAGGRILVEGGEVGYTWTRIDRVDSLFIRDVLHVTEWVQDDSGDITVTEPGHLIVTAPYALPSIVPSAYENYVDQDLMLPGRDVVVVGSWTRNSSGASIVTYDPTPETEGGRTVYFAFSYRSLDDELRAPLLLNAVNWLLLPEPGSCAVNGRVLLEGEGPADGVVVELLPDGGLALTAADGSYSFTGVVPGAYSVRATLLNWTQETLPIVLEDGETISGADLTLLPDVPRLLALHPNYPNPFNPGTTFAFDLPSESRVKLAVYDARGRLVRTILDEPLPHGYYRQPWDGTDDGGRLLASGVYFARLSVEGAVKTRKMVLVR